MGNRVGVESIMAESPELRKSLNRYSDLENICLHIQAVCHFDSHEKFGPYPDNLFYLSQNKSTTYVLPRTAIQQPAKNSVTPSAGWKPALPGDGCQRPASIGNNFENC